MRPPKISRAFGALLLPGWFAASGVSAATLQVAPVLLEVAAPGAATTVTLRNNGTRPIAAQFRVFRWVQDAGRERLEPTEDVVASPPAVELQPAQDYVVRVVRVTNKPVEGEEAYRLFIDELPEASQGQRTVNFVVRHAIPLFFDAPGGSAPEASWHVMQNGHAVSLSASNGGDRRLRLASVKVSDAAGRSNSFGPGLVGYALGRSAMTWTAAASKPPFRPGAKVTISGLRPVQCASRGAICALTLGGRHLENHNICDDRPRRRHGAMAGRSGRPVAVGSAAQR